MARLLVGGSWYEQLSRSSMYEADFEAQLLHVAEVLFPRYHAIPFKVLVSDGHASAKADFALIHQDYRDWWVVEVELSHHSLDRHVLPQVRTLSRASYGFAVAERMLKARPTFDERRLRAMLKGEQPRVLVIVDSPKLDWMHALRRYDALLAVVEIFRDEMNRYVHRVNGDAIPQQIDAVCECYRDRALPGVMLRLQSPVVFVSHAADTVKLIWDNGITLWELVEVSDRVWLMAKNPALYLQGSYFEIVRREDGEYELRSAE